MQSQAFPWKRKNLETGKDEVSIVQGALRPIELWEYCLPRESLSEICHYLGINGSGKQVHDNALKWIGKGFRAGMGLKKIPKYDEKKDLKGAWPRLLNGARAGFSIYGLGIKEDEYKEFPQWGFEQEAL